MQVLDHDKLYYAQNGPKLLCSALILS